MSLPRFFLETQVIADEPQEVFPLRLAREDAKDQRKLGREGRKANLESGVMVIEDVAGCSLLLVDDVLTTGTTVRACTRCLLEAGAADVTACALARSW